MTRFPALRVLAAALLVAGLGGCDSAIATGSAGPDLTGYAGDPALIGTWTRNGGEDYLNFSWDATTRRATENGIRERAECSIQTYEMENLTTTSYNIVLNPEMLKTYSIDSDQMRFTEGDNVGRYTRSTETLASFMPFCD